MIYSDDKPTTNRIVIVKPCRCWDGELTLDHLGACGVEIDSRSNVWRLINYDCPEDILDDSSMEVYEKQESIFHYRSCFEYYYGFHLTNYVFSVNIAQELL